MKPGDMVQIDTHNKPYLLPKLDLPYDHLTPVLPFGEFGIVLEPVRDGKFYKSLCKIITQRGAGWVSRVHLKVINETR